jgi:hypothetical protein
MEQLPDWLILGLLCIWMTLDRFNIYFRDPKDH